jgi:indole-3-glycerol phosphate synthase
MNDILDAIVAHKKKEIAAQKQQVSEAGLYESLMIQEMNESFYQAVAHPIQGDIAVIGEIKLKSPSAGVLGTEADILPRAEQYQQAGVDAISYVSDREFFGGNPEVLPELLSAVEIPVLQKDFVIDTYQIVQAAVRQVDALLLIARILEPKLLQSFVEFCFLYGIEPVVEVYNKEDLQAALATNARVIGVNARNLDTFEVNLPAAAELIAQIPADKRAIGFSGVKSRSECEQYRDAGASAVLVGETLMRTNEVQQTVEQLKGLSVATS